ncbi:hypothetical protein SAMN05421797_106154 [Maribacter ulvicola]|uniref:Uncharacterized protein n=1 Tax=Maribacter ulvicola TaxID=228959 RepID=A0A1N6YAD4_9FLAO|nr:hypothetical protein SAMN05421797_106154 [Maribacter ulvicola]
MKNSNLHDLEDTLGIMPLVKYVENNSIGASPNRIKNNNFNEI